MHDFVQKSTISGHSSFCEGQNPTEHQRYTAVLSTHAVRHARHNQPIITVSLRPYELRQLGREKAPCTPKLWTTTMWALIGILHVQGKLR